MKRRCGRELGGMRSSIEKNPSVRRVVSGVEDPPTASSISSTRRLQMSSRAGSASTTAQRAWLSA